MATSAPTKNKTCIKNLLHRIYNHTIEDRDFLHTLLLIVDSDDKLSVLGRLEVDLCSRRRVKLVELCKTSLSDETLVCSLDCMVLLKISSSSHLSVNQ